MKFFSFFLELLSFSTPRAIVVNLSGIFATLAVLPSNALYILPYRCVFKAFLIPLVYWGVCPAEGIFADCNCPACGLTRAMSRLLHGDVKGANEFNILVIPVFLIMTYLLVYNAWLWANESKSSKRKHL